MDTVHASIIIIHLSTSINVESYNVLPLCNHHNHVLPLSLLHNLEGSQHMIVLLLLLLRNLKHDIVLPLSLFRSVCYVDSLPSIEGS